MKRCPTCQKEYADSMRFCQTDGTPLVEEIVDPFKTMIASRDEIASAIPPPSADSFKTGIGGSFIDDEDDDLLQIADETDSVKTMISPGNFRQGASSSEEVKEDATTDSPFGGSSAPKNDAPNFGSVPLPEMPKFKEPDLSPPSFGSSPFESSSGSEQDAAPFDSNPFSNESPNKSTFNNPPIPSPFDLSMPPGYQPPSTPPFGEPAAPFNEPEPQTAYDAPQQNAAFNPPAFDQYQDPFGGGGQMQQTEWMPPPAPEANWQNQDIGQNTPFQPPMVGAQGEDKTLAIVSLVCGILSLTCCGAITGIAALITGFMAKNNVDANPNQYGGRGMALAGMIMGGISIVLTVLWLVFVVLGGALR